jgi:hypothetical protein
MVGKNTSQELVAEEDGLEVAWEVAERLIRRKGIDPHKHPINVISERMIYKEGLNWGHLEGESASLMLARLFAEEDAKSWPRTPDVRFYLMSMTGVTKYEYERIGNGTICH